MDKSDRLYRILEEANQRVKNLPEWRRSEETNRELRRLAEEQLRRDVPKAK